jgi:hypothetical protein
MRKSNAAKARELDWSEFTSPYMPLTPVVHPKGTALSQLVERLRKAFERAKIKISA